MVSSNRRFNLQILIILHLCVLLPVVDHNFKSTPNEFVKVIERLNISCSAAKSEDESKEYLPMVMTYLTPALKEQARIELNETEELREKALAELKRMIKAAKKHFVFIDEYLLLSFLRKEKFNVEEAFNGLRNFEIFSRDLKERLLPEQEHTITTDHTLSVFRKNMMGNLEFRDRKGSAVFFFRMGAWDPEEDSFAAVFGAAGVLNLYAMEQVPNQVIGSRLIFDARGIGWKHLRFLTPFYAIMMGRSIKNMHGRFKAIHLLSEDLMLNFVWTLSHNFLPQKIQELIFFHGDNLSDLQHYIHPSTLPEEFGGTAPPLDNGPQMHIFTERTEKFVRSLYELD